MQEQLVSFKVAKLAKEKLFGIDFVGTEYVPAFYCKKSDVNNFQETEIQIEDGFMKDFYLRPTQSLLQKWLRDKHEIHIFVIPCEPSSYSKYKHLSVVWIYDIYKHLLVEYGHSNKGDNLSYEQALDEGLYEALTLIKNE